MASGGETVRVTVRFFARAHDLAGTANTSLVLDAPASVADAAAVLKTRYPALGEHLDRCRIAVDTEFAEPGQALKEGSELAIIPPVSGG